MYSIAFLNYETWIVCGGRDFSEIKRCSTNQWVRWFRHGACRRRSSTAGAQRKRCRRYGC